MQTKGEQQNIKFNNTKKSVREKFMKKKKIMTGVFDTNTHEEMNSHISNFILSLKGFKGSQDFEQMNNLKVFYTNSFAISIGSTKFL